MRAKVDSTFAPEPHKMSGASSAAPTSSQKLSIFASKSGFVIPKNKLSGSLVPTFRGAKKHGVTGATNEESLKQIERKTKWGPDLTQDAAVRRGKALALQIRVDQITQQLKSEKMEVENTQHLPFVAENLDHSYSGPQINSKKSEMLEFEKREAIGEILKLDPSYKPPPGFKPLLKEASVPLPVKEFPGYNFIGLIYGPEGDNQKRLEKETGAKIKVHGTKADTGEKGEIKPGNDIQCSYEEIHVNISADSFDKVDAAVSIIELLTASITGNLAARSTPSLSVSGDNTIVLGQSQDGPPSHAVSSAVENHDVVQPVASAQMHGGHFQYSGPWFSAVPSHTPVFSSGNIAPPNPSGLARTPHFPSQMMNPSNMASNFGAQPVPVAGLHPFIPNQHVSLQEQPPRQILQHSHMSQASPMGHIGPPRNPSMISVRNLSAATNASPSFPLSLSQPTPLGQLQASVSSMPQPMSGISPAPIPNQPLTRHGASTGQNGPPVTVKVSLGLSNMEQMAPPVNPPTRPVSLLHPQQDVAFKPPMSNISMASHSAKFPPHQAGISPGLPSPLGSTPLPIHAPTHSSVNHLSGPASFPSPGISPSLPLSQQSVISNSASGVTPYHSHVKPPVLTTSNSGNFTFQSQRPNADSQVVSRPNNQATAQGGTQEQPSGPRPLPFGFSVPDQPFTQIFPRTQVPNQVDQTQARVSAVPFGGRSSSISIPPRQTAFPYAGQPAPRSPVPQMGMKNFISAPQMPNLPSPGLPRAGNMQTRPNYPAQRTWSDIPLPLNQKFGNNHSMGPGKPAYPADQIYDPFSPTSVAPPQQKGNPGK